MSLTTEGMTPADFAAVCGNSNRNDGFGGDWGWIVLLLLLAGNGWGGGFGGGFGGFNNAALGVDFPWLLNGQNSINNNVSDGFRSAQLSDGLTAIQSGVQNLSTQLCGCCGDIQQSLCNGFAGVEQGANARQIANMNQNFGMQTAMMQGFNNIGTQFADCLKKIIKKAKGSLVFTKYAVGSCAA